MQTSYENYPPPSKELLKELCTFIEKTFGFYFPKQGWHDLQSKVIALMRAFKFATPSDCIEYLISTSLEKNQWSKIIEVLTVGETYFFRDPAAFAALENTILPKIINSKKGKEEKLRIWSTACATGEEAYSIAIVLHRLIPNLEEWDIEILATDINIKFLEKAKLGRYKKWSFRGTAAEVKKRYFQELKNDEYEILPEIRAMVKFRYINLAEEFELGESLLNKDLILCNNVLIYFSPAHINRIIGLLTTALTDIGWLGVTPIEAPYVQDPRLAVVPFEHAIFFSRQPSEVVKTKKRGSLSNESALMIPQKNREEPSIKVVLPEFMNPKEPVIEFSFAIPKDVSKSLSKKKQLTEPPELEPSYGTLFELYQRGDYDKLISMSENLFSSKAKNTAFLLRHLKELVLLVHAYANLGDLAHAKSWCERALDVEKLDPLLHYLYGTILQEEGKIPDAVKSFKHAIFLDQTFVIAYFALGSLALQQKKQKEATRYFRNALQLLESHAPDTDVIGTEGITVEQLRDAITKQL